jgi:hypothetical protein
MMRVRAFIWWVTYEICGVYVLTIEQPAIDVEAAVRDGGLDVGVFAPGDLLDGEGAEKLLDELRDLLRGCEGWGGGFGYSLTQSLVYSGRMERALRFIRVCACTYFSTYADGEEAWRQGEREDLLRF